VPERPRIVTSRIFRQPRSPPTTRFKLQNESPKGGIYAVSNPSIVHTSDATFDKDVLKSDKPVLLDFWAEWCGPCKMIAPILDEIANEKGSAIKVAKVNVDENQGLSSKFGIRAIPTLLLFKNGSVREQIVGMTSKRDLIAKLEALA
jgi:thioredoxin 1